MPSPHAASPRARHSALRAAALAVLVLCAGWPSSAPALAGGTLYVDGTDPSCSNSGPGTSSRPHCSIVRAAQVARAGDTVVVRSGTYAGTVTVSSSGTAGSPIVFMPAGGANVTVTSSSSYGFRISGRSHVRIQGFRVSGTTLAGISVSNATGIVIADNEVSNSGAPVSGGTESGIELSGCTGCTVRSNTIHHNTYHGIYLNGGTTQTSVVGNESFANAQGYARAAAGISASNSTRNRYEANVAHDNEDTGIQLRSGADDNLVVNNISYSNGDHGYDTLRATGARYVNNVAFGNVRDGISIEGSSTGATLANNISVDNGLSTGHYDLWVSDSSVSGFAADFDVIWNSTSQRPIKIGGTTYASVSALRSATGHEAHGVGADPRFAAPGSGDFHLQPGSPAIDSADASASGWRSTDAAGRGRSDDRDTPNTGTGSPSFSDRGALEYQGGGGGGGTPPPADPPPATPAGPGIDPETVGLRLDWKNNDELDLAGYHVYRRVGDAFTRLNDRILRRSAFLDRAAPAGATSSYRVVAVDLGGNRSSPATASADRSKISLRSASAGATRDATRLDVPTPRRLRRGDLVLACVQIAADPSSVRLPTGWTLVRQDLSKSGVVQLVLWKLAGRSEPAAFRWKWRGLRTALGVAAAYRGIARSDPVAAEDGAPKGRSTEITAPSLSGGRSGQVLVGLFGLLRNGRIAPDDRMWEQAEGKVASGAKLALELADEVVDADGSTGVRVATTGKAARSIGQAVLLRPRP